MFQIHPDIREAETLSSDFYTDSKYFELSKERIFAQSWQLIGIIDDFDNIKPHTLLEGFLDEPILITKQDQKINCLSNVCTHRGKVLVENNCSAGGIICGYHGRRFDLNGKFLSMPEFEDVKNFPSEKDNLSKIPFDSWNNFVFASINPISPLSEFITEMQNTLGELNVEKSKFSSNKEYLIEANWALYCENYLEGFHIPFVHKSLNEELDFNSYTTEIFNYSSLQTGLDKNGKIAAYYFFVFPNLMFNFYPWGLSVNIVKPITKTSTKIEYWTFVNDESKLNRGAGADLEAVELEDQKVVESVQKGINSRFYEKGRYSPNREQGTHHFHRLISKFMQK